MNKSIVSFTIVLVILSVVIGLVAQQLARPSFMISILAVLSLSTWMVYFFMLKATLESFIKNYILSIVLKIIAGGIFISILIYLDKDGAERNALFFMITYFLFTGLEVGFLFSKFGRSS